MNRQLLGMLLAGFSLFGNLSHCEAATPKEPASLLIGLGQESNYALWWEEKIYQEAFSRLGIKVSFVTMSIARLDSSIEEGYVDVTAPRALKYGEEHPNLIRSEESAFDIVFAVYTANPTIHWTGLESIAPDSTGEYRRGVLGCENALKPWTGRFRISDIVNTEQGLKKLKSNRIDFFCEIDVAVMDQKFDSNAEDFSTIRKAFDIGKPVALYPYLNKKHAALAPRLAAVLKQMKEEGLIEQYRKYYLRKAEELQKKK